MDILTTIILVAVASVFAFITYDAATANNR